MSPSSSPCLFCAEECSPTYTVIDGEVRRLKYETEQVQILENPASLSTSEEIESIRGNLEVVFILREIFNYPSEKCLPYLGESGGQIHPEHWFTVCPRCRTCVQECYRIQRMVTQLEKKLVVTKNKLKHSIFISTKTKKKPTKQSRTYNRTDNIWNDVRSHVLQAHKDVLETMYDDQNSTDIFLEGFAKIAGDDPGAVFPDEDYLDMWADDSPIPSPNSPNTTSDVDWSPDLNEMKAKGTEKVDRHLREPKLRQKRKKFNPPMCRSRLSRAKPCKLPKQKVTDNPQNTSHDSQDNVQDDTNEIIKEESPLTISKPKTKKRTRKRLPKMKRSCDECLEKFRTLDSLAIHKRSVHPTNSDSGEELKCPECTEVFVVSRSLLFHLNRFHRPQGKGSDVKWYRDGSGFKKLIKKTKIPYYCDYCDIVLWGRCRLIHHVKDHHGSRREAACQYCEEKLESKQLLQFHLEAVHPQVPEVANAVHPKTEETPQSCIHCSESFPTKMKLDYHIATIHKHTCSECGHIVAGHPQLKNHLMTVHNIGERSVFCELCSKRYVDRMGLICHQQVEHYEELGLTPFICTICGLVAPAEINLKAHIRTVHEKVKTHFCEFCGKGFTTSADLQRHILIHTAPKEERYKKGPFFCQFCNAKFNVRQGLYYHLKQKHNDTFSFRCDNCGKGYCTSHMLKQHKKSCVKKVGT